MRALLNCAEVTNGACGFTVAGEEDEVLVAALAHAGATHGLSDSTETRAVIVGAMRRDEGRSMRGYGTTMIGRLKSGTLDDIRDSLERWEREHHAPGFLGAQVQVSEDGTIVNTAVFTDRTAYEKLADDPAQDEWYQRDIAPRLDGEPKWIDGEWDVYVRRPSIVLPEQATGKAKART
jgi:predicted small metal-binding protein